jgi:hypothetical protein
MTRRLPLPLLSVAVLLAACGGPGAKGPAQAHADLPAGFAAAFVTDAAGPVAAPSGHAAGDAGDATSRFLDLARTAAAADGDPWQVAALAASLDALATRLMPSLGDAAANAGLAWRTADVASIADGLARAQAEARGPFARGLVGRALATIAQRRGDAAAAEKHRTESGCAREAIVIGPTTWVPVTGVEEAGPLDRADARIEATYKLSDAFATVLHPVAVRGRGCAIDLSAESVRPGVRDVVVDVTVDRAQTIGLALRAHGAATLRAGGAVVLRRPFELGDGEAARFARATVTAGVLRVVARVGTATEDDTVEIDAWGEDGKPLPAKAPEVGSAGTVSSARVVGVASVEAPPAKAPSELLLAAAAANAMGSAREAERMLWGTATRADAPPELALVYGRAIETARDLSPATRAERSRSAYQRVLEAWPKSWEAAIAHAVLAGVRRGREEAGLETLRDLDALRAKMGDAPPAILDAFDALISGRERLFDRARAALERAHGRLAGVAGVGTSAILAAAEDAATPRQGAELAEAACDLGRPVRHDTLACFDALRAIGARAPGRATAELARLRQLLGAPQRFLSVELRQDVATGDAAAAARAFAAMLPAERTLAAIASLDSSPDVRAHLLRAAAVARDAPASIAPLLRAAGDEPTRDLDGIADRVAAQDRATPILPNAATAVLAHKERYDLDASGLLHWRLFDVRRVSGTTDVDQNAQAAAPEVWGRGVARALRRRILKHDGRVLEPDRTPRASQAHADLSQLEQGDVVEAIYEGWSLPGDTGDVGIDTPDLLPERAAVHDATIELRVPQAVRGALWSHREIGKPAATVDGDARVLTWHVVDHPARRVEDGVPKMDRNAGVSFSTAQWSDVARALRETIATLDEHDPEIAAWARDAGNNGNAAPTRQTVEAVVAAAGAALRESNAATLSDYGGGIAPVQAETARTFLASHEGSRSWLVARALRELGVPRDVVVAENEPYSGDPSFPPHFGRFSHPLVVAHVAGGDVWIDADVAGPPLPAGRVSPELRGRLALRTDGAIAPLPAIDGGPERDEIDVRLALDAQGSARGTFVAVLRGRDAQSLAEALFRIVGAERQRALRDVVLAWLPWANVDDVQLSSSEGSWQVSLRAEVSVSGYAQQDGEKTWLLPGLDTLHWSWPRARVSSLGATFATRAGRENELAVNTAVQYHVHRRVELPKGASVKAAPGPLEVKTKLVDASRRIAVAQAPSDTALPVAVEDDFVLGVATGTVQTSDYEAFVRAAHAADDGFLASTRVSIP